MSAGRTRKTGTNTNHQPHRTMIRPKTITKRLGSITSDLGRDALVVLTLSDGKDIVRIKTPRKVEWWLVYPAKGDDDYRAQLIGKIRHGGKYDGYEFINTANAEFQLLKEYSDRVTLIVGKDLRRFVYKSLWSNPRVDLTWYPGRVKELREYRHLLSDHKDGVESARSYALNNPTK